MPRSRMKELGHRYVHLAALQHAFELTAQNVHIQENPKLTIF